MARKEEKPLPERPVEFNDRTLGGGDVKWDAIQQQRIERRKRRAKNRERSEEWVRLKKEAAPFAFTKSDADLRNMAWNHLIDGNPVVAAIINELLSRRRKMNRKLYALAVKHKHTLYGIDFDNQLSRARKAKKAAIASGADDVRQLRRLAKQVRDLG